MLFLLQVIRSFRILKISKYLQSEVFMVKGCAQNLFIYYYSNKNVFFLMKQCCLLTSMLNLLSSPNSPRQCSRLVHNKPYINSFTLPPRALTWHLNPFIRCQTNCATAEFSLKNFHGTFFKNASLFF